MPQGRDLVTKGNSGACPESLLLGSAPFGVPTPCPVICGGSKERSNQPHPGELTLRGGWWAVHGGAPGYRFELLPTSGQRPQLVRAAPWQGGYWPYLWDQCLGRGLGRVERRERTGIGSQLCPFCARDLGRVNDLGPWFPHLCKGVIQAAPQAPAARRSDEPVYQAPGEHTLGTHGYC